MSIAIASPIERRTLHEDLAEELRRLIVEGEMKPGEKISEKDLCTLFGVSRTPLREALKILATEGLVLLTPNRGASVTQLTLSDFSEVFPIMGALEALAGELACRNITDAEIKKATRLQQEMENKYEYGELKDYFRINQEIHQLIIDAAQNPALAQMHKTLSAQVRRARFMANISKTRWAEAVKEHRTILEALSKRDETRLSALMKAHIANKFAALKEKLA